MLDFYLFFSQRKDPEKLISRGIRWRSVPDKFLLKRSKTRSRLCERSHITEEGRRGHRLTPGGLTMSASPIDAVIRAICETCAKNGAKVSEVLAAFVARTVSARLLLPSAHRDRQTDRPPLLLPARAPRAVCGAGPFPSLKIHTHTHTHTHTLSLSVRCRDRRWRFIFLAHDSSCLSLLVASLLASTHFLTNDNRCWKATRRSSSSTPS